MSTQDRLSDTDVQERLAGLDGWALAGNAIERGFEFVDFAEAFGFMAAVACVAERLNHHPDWSNTYNRVSITLSSHDVGGLSDRDFRLARRINQLLA